MLPGMTQKMMQPLRNRAEEAEETGDKNKIKKNPKTNNKQNPNVPLHFLKESGDEGGGSSYYSDTKISRLEQLNKQKLVF